MTDSGSLVAVLLVVIFIAHHMWYVKTREKELQEIIRGLLSKNAEQFTSSRLMEAPKKPTKPQDELVPTEFMSEAEFNAMIKRSLDAPKE